MKNFLPTVALIALASALAPCAHADESVAGKWKAEFDSQIGTQKYTFELKVEDGKLTGRAVGERRWAPTTSRSSRARSRATKSPSSSRSSFGPRKSALIHRQDQRRRNQVPSQGGRSRRIRLRRPTREGRRQIRREAGLKTRVEGFNQFAGEKAVRIDFRCRRRRSGRCVIATGAEGKRFSTARRLCIHFARMKPLVFLLRAFVALATILFRSTGEAQTNLPSVELRNVIRT